MIRTIYKCDRCGTEQATSAQFWTVGVMANQDGYPATSFVRQRYLQVCRPCLDTMGVFVQEKVADKESPPSPTTEDLIREILERAGVLD